MVGASIFNLRNRLLASARFRRWVQKIPVIQRVANSRATSLFRVASGFIHSQVLLTCVRMGLFDRLAAGPLPVASVAADAGWPEDRTRHLLHAAAALELLELRPGDTVGLGKLGATMVGNEAIGALVEHHALVYEDLEDPVSLFAGSAGATRMSALWPYAGAERPASLAADDVRRYTELMAASQTMVAEQVVDAFPFRRHSTLLDIGGGAGAFAMAVARRWPHIGVTVADLPAVAGLAADAVAAAGLSERVTVVGADAVAGELPTGFDVVSLVRILHDHDDDRALAMLEAARRALAPGGTLLIAEPLAGPDPAGALIDAYFQVYLLAMGSGRPRTVGEISALATSAGFGPVRRHRVSVSLVTSVLSAQVDSVDVNTN